MQDVIIDEALEGEGYDEATLAAVGIPTGGQTHGHAWWKASASSNESESPCRVRGEWVGVGHGMYIQ